MNRSFPILLSLAAASLLGCPGTTLPPLPPMSEAPSAAASASASPSAAPSGASAAPSAAPSGSPAPAQSASPKPSKPPAATPTPGPSPNIYMYYPYMRFTYPASWAITRELKDPFRFTLSASYDTAVLTIREIRQTQDLAAQQKLVVATAGDGLVTNASTTLDKLKGFTVTWNRTENNRSRHHITRGYIYKESYFEIDSNYDRPSDQQTQVEKDIAAMIKGWLWQ